nr:adenylyltransferase/cytidyltransferase family protein [uncultured Dorea sp.]
MPDYYISQISHTDKTAIQGVTALLNAEGIRLDANLDYTCGMYDDEMNIIATGSCFGNTLRCLAVSSEHQGEGLMNQIISHLIEVQFERGNTHLFLYTKCSSAKFFGDLGFYEIARIDGQIVFMENRRTGFKNYLKKLEESSALQLQTLTKDTSANTATLQSDNALPDTSTADRKIAALIMNANPFTLGHQYLVEKAARENDLLHLFIVSEDASLVPFKVRKQLVMEGTAHLDNICYHDSGPYIISNATFPSYFQKDENAVIESHAMLDLTIFTEIAQTLGINRRYVGEEPTSLVTGIYNNIMSEKLPENGIECIIVPRKTDGKKAISASTVRQAIKDNDVDTLKKLVPESTLRYFESKEAKEVIERIRNSGNVIHY